MNILIINQPLNNRGDESAHKALVRCLAQKLPDSYIKILFVDGNADSIRQYSVQFDNVEYINLSPFKGYGRFIKPVLKNKRYWLWYFHPTTRKILKIYGSSDWIICAPGGICMGGFQNWTHLFFLKIAQFMGKKLAYYGRSFGPFPEETDSNRLFKTISIDLLHYFSFLSIRDALSEKLAEKLGVNYVKTVDTAFLDSPEPSLPDDVKKMIGETKYIVFVPNLLIWHYAFKERLTKDTVLNFYNQIYKKIIKVYPDCKVVMLPQTFNNEKAENNDVNFFHELKSLINDERIIVAPDRYSSDIQQKIISGAECMIGSRYHSIVFAINNNVPFVALSYEHKISGLLESLEAQKYMVDITNGLDSDEEIERTVSRFYDIITNVQLNRYIRVKAKQIANACFDVFLNLIK